MLETLLDWMAGSDPVAMQVWTDEDRSYWLHDPELITKRAARIFPPQEQGEATRFHNADVTLVRVWKSDEVLVVEGSCITAVLRDPPAKPSEPRPSRAATLA